MYVHALPCTVPDMSFYVAQWGPLIQLNHVGEWSKSSEQGSETMYNTYVCESEFSVCSEKSIQCAFVKRIFYLHSRGGDAI